MTFVWQAARRSARGVLDSYWGGLYPVRVSEISREMGVMAYRAKLPYGLSGMVISDKDGLARSYADTDELGVCRRCRCRS